MGRFQSPDWSAKEAPVPYATLENPQSLNLYSYVLNNPLSNVDADGHACISLVNASSGFCTRAAEYQRFDANQAISSQIRFFAAASVVSTALGDIALPGRSLYFSDITAGFLEGIGQKLQRFNQSAASRIESGTMHGPGLDQDLVHQEQSIVQEQLDGLRNLDPQAYKAAIADINGAINRASTNTLGLLLDNDYTTVVRRVRKSLGRDIDFSKQSDREAIGVPLIKDRRGSYTPFTGMCPAQYASCQ
jgi:hypothetical protein